MSSNQISALLYEPMCTPSAEVVDPPNMIGPYEKGPDPVQCITKWSRDHSRQEKKMKNTFSI